MKVKQTNTTFFIFIVLLIACNKTEFRSASFNEEIRKNFDENSLTEFGIDPYTRCIMKCIVNEKLDKLNNWKTTEVNGEFLVRNFYDEDSSLDFSFILDHRENIYLVALFDLPDFIYRIDDRYRFDGDHFVFKDSSIVFYIHGELVNKFFNSINPGSIDDEAKIQMVDRILPEIFNPYFRSTISKSGFSEISNSLFNEKKISENDYRNIIEITLAHNVRICQIEDVGWLTFRHDNGNIMINFIASPIRLYRFARVDNIRDCRNCL